MFAAVRHDCGAVLMDALFTGVARVKCGGCTRRVWVVSDGVRVSVALVDSAPREVIESGQPNTAP